MKMETECTGLGWLETEVGRRPEAKRESDELGRALRSVSQKLYLVSIVLYPL